MRDDQQRAALESLSGADLLDRAEAVIARNTLAIARTRALVARTMVLVPELARSGAARFSEGW